MKTCFISVPMRGRTDEAIKNSIARLEAMAKVVFGEDTCCVNGFTNVAPYDTSLKNPSMWYMGESIKLMAKCDCALLPEPDIRYPGCQVERRAASEFRLAMFEYDQDVMFPDLLDPANFMAKMINV